MGKQDKNRSAKDPDSEHPSRVKPIMGLEGPFTELVDRGQASERHLRIEDPSELFRLLRAALDNAQFSDLILASRCGYRQKVEDLLAEGANVNDGDDSGTTALIESLTYGQFEIAEILIEKGANVRAASSSGWTPLHLIASFGAESLGGEIVRRGGDLNAKTELGLTPVMIAARRRRFRMVKFIIDNGADLDLKDSTGATALIHASKGDQDESGGDPLSISALVKAGAVVNAQDNSGMTPLMAVSFYGDIGSVRLFLEKGADMSARDAQGRTALAMAIFGQKVEIIQALQAAGATQ